MTKITLQLGKKIELPNDIFLISCSLVRLYDESKIALLLSRRDITFAASHYSVRTEKGAVGRDLSADSQVMQLNASWRYPDVILSAARIKATEKCTSLT